SGSRGQEPGSGGMRSDTRHSTLDTRSLQHEARSTEHGTRNTEHSSPALSIADLLESTVEEAIEFLAGFPESRPADRALAGLSLLQEVGLGYLKLGQPINTLSGGESQRLKLVRHLAESDIGTSTAEPEPLDSSRLSIHETRNTEHEPRRAQPSPPSSTLFLFDEPTTGLHFDDVRF